MDAIVGFSLVGFSLVSFMAAYLGYYQIKMYPDDKEKTSFIIEKGTFCYTIMPNWTKKCRCNLSTIGK